VENRLYKAKISPRISDLKGRNIDWGSGKRVLRIFQLKIDELTGRWRKMRNEELRNLYSSRSTIRIIKSRRMRLSGHVTQMREKGNGYTILVGNPERNTPLGGLRHRLVLDSEMDF
jgi:hypothetical protein